MRRLLAIAAMGFAAAATVGLTGLSGSAAAAGASKIVEPGSVWTAYIAGSSCEVLTFGPQHTHTFSADKEGDAGTYKGGRSHLNQKWTSGTDAGLTSKGKYVSSSGVYDLTLGGIGAGLTGELISGNDPLGWGTC